jgi:hypothetical protein
VAAPRFEVLSRLLGLWMQSAVICATEAGTGSTACEPLPVRAQQDWRQVESERPWRKGETEGTGFVPRSPVSSRDALTARLTSFLSC